MPPHALNEKERGESRWHARDGRCKKRQVLQMGFLGAPIPDDRLHVLSVPQRQRRVTSARDDSGRHEHATHSNDGGTERCA